MATHSFALRRGRELLSHRTVPLQIAPLRLRLLAALINAVIGLSAIPLLIAAGAGGLSVMRRVRDLIRRRVHSDSDDSQAARDGDPEPAGLAESPFFARLQSPPVKVAIGFCGLAVDVAREGKARSPGAHVLGIRLVDARTGERISRRQAFLRAGSRRAWQLAITRLVPQHSPNTLSDQEREDYRAKMQAAHRQFPDDTDARQEAFKRIHRELPKPDMRGCWLTLVARLLLAIAIELPSLWSPLKQGVPDKLAGTVHVVERRDGLVGALVGRLS